MKGVADASALYEVERRAYHAARASVSPSFRSALRKRCPGTITTTSTTRSMS